VVAGFLLLLAYPLSAGPYVWLADRGVISRSTSDRLASTIYLPLAWLYDNVPWYHELHSRYRDWWTE
jgi:hypothetical protein